MTYIFYMKHLQLLVVNSYRIIFVFAIDDSYYLDKNLEKRYVDSL